MPMDSVIEKLFYGKIIPCETPCLKDAHMLALQEQYRQSYEALAGKLDQPLRKELSRVVDDCVAVDAREGAMVFVEGFRLGAAMMLDMLHGGKTE